MTELACIRGCKERVTYDDGTTDQVPMLTHPPLLLCDPCVKRFTHWLEDIPVTYALLPAVIEPGSVERDPDSTRGARAIHSPALARVEVIDLTDLRREGRGDEARGVLGIVEGWARMVREERGMTAIGKATIQSETTLLVNHVDWICSQPWVDECYEEIRTAHRDLTTAIGDYRARPVGRCPVVYDDGECGGVLLPTRLGNVNCAACQAHWDRDELSRLGLLLNA